MQKKLQIFLSIFAFFIFILINTVFIVDETEHKLVLSYGKNVKYVASEAGPHFKVPFLDSVVTFEKRVLNTDTDEILAILVDKKQLIIDTFARYKIVNPLLFYQRVVNERKANLKLKNIIESATRSTLGKQALDNVLSGERQNLMDQIQSSVDKETKNLGIEIVDVRIKRADLPNENSQSVFNRMKSEREAIATGLREEGNAKALLIKSTAQKESDIILASANKKAEIIRGEGDGERNRIYAEAFSKDPSFFEFYRSLKAYDSILGKDQDASIILSTDSEFLQFLDKKITK